jgi:TonB family protein
VARFWLFVCVLITCFEFPVWASQAAADSPSTPPASEHKSSSESSDDADTSAPVLTEKVAPEYSDEARRTCKEGTVKLSVVVDESGMPQKIRVTQPLGSGLDDEAVRTVRKWRFRPAMKAGRPVAVQARVELHFRAPGCGPSRRAAVGTPRETILTQPPAPGSLPPKDAPLGVRVLQVQWTARGFSVDGSGRANLIEGTHRQGFDFTFSCSKPFVPNETSASALYPARWKKSGTRLVITSTEMRDPRKRDSCELKVELRPVAYALPGAK